MQNWLLKQSLDNWLTQKEKAGEKSVRETMHSQKENWSVEIL